MGLICMSALGWHLSVITQSSSHTDITLLQESNSALQASTPIPLNTGCTETNLTLHPSTEVTTEKNPQCSCKKYVYILFN